MSTRGRDPARAGARASAVCHTLDAPRRWLRTQLDIENHEKSIDDVLDEDSDEDSKAVFAPQAIDEDDLLVAGVRV